MIPAAALLAAALSPSLQGRRLLAADFDVPRREARVSGLPLAIDVRGGASPEIVFDLERVPGLPPGEAAAEYARALAAAEIAAPIPLVEAEQASLQWTSQVLVEAALSDAKLSKALREAERKPSRSSPILGEAAAFAARFERDPKEAYWGVESAQAPETGRLTDVEDQFALRAAEIRALPEPPSGPYGVLSSRRYPGALVRACFRLRAPGTLERLREALGAYDTVGVVPFADSIKRWRKSLLPR
ncbi:MAG TPA: hypothetical protein VN915_05215 [Elusimicrobiota bacterium]|nr:hypothetical protein [Elusimicrobiota bacterium]